MAIPTALPLKGTYQDIPSLDVHGSETIPRVKQEIGTVYAYMQIKEMVQGKEVPEALSNLFAQMWRIGDVYANGVRFTQIVIQKWLSPLSKPMPNLFSCWIDPAKKPPDDALPITGTVKEFTGRKWIVRNFVPFPDEASLRAAAKTKGINCQSEASEAKTASATSVTEADAALLQSVSETIHSQLPERAAPETRATAERSSGKKKRVSRPKELPVAVPAILISKKRPLS